MYDERGGIFRDEMTVFLLEIELLEERVDEVFDILGKDDPLTVGLLGERVF